LKGEKTSDYIAWEDCPKIEEALFKAKQYRIYLYLLLGRHIALRASDMFTLTWNDILKSEIVLDEQKTGKNRKITIKDEVLTKIYKVYDKLKPKRDELVFRSFSKKGTMSSQYISKKLRYYAAPIVGWDKHISTHSVRKTFGRRVYEQALNKEHALIMLNEIFNHSTMRVTRVYLGIREEEIKDIYKNL
jgi:site-specific recombinase XerD